MDEHEETASLKPTTHGASQRKRSVSRRLALEALCSDLAPAAPAGELADAVESRLAHFDPLLARRVLFALDLFDSPLIGLLLHGRPVRFRSLPRAARHARLRAWERSRIGARRTVFQALRRLILATWYTLPAGQRHAGYRGPYHVRGPLFPWEGPLPGVPDDREPVARTGGDVPSASGTPAPPHRVPAASAPVRPPPGTILEGRTMPSDTLLRADVCVVGTGAGGAVVAARLAEAGRDVVLLEEGGYWTEADFTEDEAAMTARLYAEGGARATEDLAITLLQGRSVGGGTTVNWMLMLRPAESVMAEWARLCDADTLAAAELVPALERIESEVHARIVPDDAHSAQNRVILEGAAELGWAARPAAINAAGCVRAGSCGLGCRFGAKQSALVTYVPRALRAGARLVADASVQRIEGLERGGRAPLKRVHATVLERDSGRPRGRLTVEAPVVVLSAGAVGTPVILQRSGLGGPAVGRFLRLHPTTAVEGLYPRDMYGAGGIPQSSLLTEFAAGSDGYGFWVECPPLLPGLAAVAMPGFGAEHADRMASFPVTAGLIVLVRDGAETGRSAGSVRVDRRGRPKIRYRLGEPERRQLILGMQAAARLHLAAGAREALTLHSDPVRVRTESDLNVVAQRSLAPNRIALFSAHVNGTCRMGSDRSVSGCSPDGEVWRAPGVFVADGSILPTAPGVNPQATIMAAASVIAERILARTSSS